MYISIKEKEEGIIIIEGVSPEEIAEGKPTFYSPWQDAVQIEKDIQLCKRKITITLKGFVPPTLELVKRLPTSQLKEYLKKHPTAIGDFTKEELLNLKE